MGLEGLIVIKCLTGIDLLFWVYHIIQQYFINHEIDSAYWKEWKLINNNDKAGIRGFLITHIPKIFFVLLVLVYEHTVTGFIISLILSSTFQLQNFARRLIKL